MHFIVNLLTLQVVLMLGKRRSLLSAQTVMLASSCFATALTTGVDFDPSRVQL